jgi:hypothetical protein
MNALFWKPQSTRLYHAAPAHNLDEAAFASTWGYFRDAVLVAKDAEARATGFVKRKPSGDFEPEILL